MKRLRRGLLRVRARSKGIDKMLEKLEDNQWQFLLSKKRELSLLDSIEQGRVLFLPHLAFDLSTTEKKFLTPLCQGPKSKNISFNSQTRSLKGHAANEDAPALQEMMMRFAHHARTLIESLFPYYTDSLEWGKTSFRPLDVKERKASSYRKDDTRLHVDAFASQPVQGRRLLRVFSNVNPQTQPRVWRLGEPFEKVAQHFVPPLSHRSWIPPTFLQKLGITKGYRTSYDFIMLQLHNAMKADLDYQKNVCAEEVSFPSGSTWVVMTDKASHAALSGQFLFEQTFYLPVLSMHSPEKSPLSILETLLGKKLIDTKRP